MQYVQKNLKYGINKKVEFLNQLKHEKIFWVGLLFKIICIVIFAPEIHNKWFLNFISFTIENFSLNPWNAFFNSYRFINLSIDY